MKILRKLVAIFRPAPAPTAPYNFSELDREFMSAMMDTALSRSGGTKQVAH